MADDKEVKYHYHARLECGHRVGFDTPADLFGMAIEQGARDVGVTMPCDECGRVERNSTNVMPGGQDVEVCLICKKGVG